MDLGVNRTGSKANVMCLTCAGFYFIPKSSPSSKRRGDLGKRCSLALIFLADLSLPTKSLEQGYPENCKLLFRREL